MSKLPSVFNAKDHGGRMGFQTIPPGWYKSQITKSEMKTTKNKEGKYLQIMEKVIEGQHKGSVIFTRLNLINKNDVAVSIAQNELGTICDACGKGKVEDSEELHGIPHWIEVVIEEGKDDNPDQNRIKMYSKDKPKDTGGDTKKTPFGSK